jgi:hypothetical protein
MKYLIFLILVCIILVAVPAVFDGIVLVFKGLYYAVYTLFAAAGTVGMILLMIAGGYVLFT